MPTQFRFMTRPVGIVVDGYRSTAMAEREAGVNRSLRCLYGRYVGRAFKAGREGGASNRRSHTGLDTDTINAAAV